MVRRITLGFSVVNITCGLSDAFNEKRRNNWGKDETAFWRATLNLISIMYYVGTVIKQGKIDGHVAHMVEMGNE